MTKSGLVRNLEQIQETDSLPRGSRLGTLLLVSLGAACVIFAVLSQAKRPATSSAAHPPDPLGDLVAQARTPAPVQSSELGGKEVTFPAMLSDDPRTTTALAAVHSSGAAPARNAAAGPDPVAAPQETSTLPSAASSPPATDRLPVVPLPARNVVSASPVVSHPRDLLAQMAKEASTPAAAPAEEGHTGAYQLQTSSFRKEADAAAFATALRQRGHRAYVETAQVQGRGTWYRVRVGPFKTQKEAASYRAEFERREHLVPFIVDPPRDPSPPKPSAHE